MKLTSKHFVLFTLLAFACVLLAAEKPISWDRGIKVESTNTATVKLTLQAPGAMATNALEIWRGGNLELAIPGTNTVATLKTNLGIQSGQGVTASDGTVTNTFSIAFSAVPRVVVTPFYNGTALLTNHTTVITTSNFVYKAGVASVTNNWIAIGAP